MLPNLLCLRIPPQITGHGREGRSVSQSSAGSWIGARRAARSLVSGFMAACCSR